MVIARNPRRGNLKKRDCFAPLAMTKNKSMRVELTRFKVKKGKSKRVDDWMKMLKRNMPAVKRSLKDEKMYVETIFREFNGNDEYLYWYSIQGGGGIPIKQSKHEIDKKHLEFWKECMDKKSKNYYKDMKTELVLIPERIKKNMKG